MAGSASAFKSRDYPPPVKEKYLKGPSLSFLNKLPYLVAIMIVLIVVADLYYNLGILNNPLLWLNSFVSGIASPAAISVIFMVSVLIFALAALQFAKPCLFRMMRGHPEYEIWKDRLALDARGAFGDNKFEILFGDIRRIEMKKFQEKKIRSIPS